jgi:hypothetical protein
VTAIMSGVWSVEDIGMEMFWNPSGDEHTTL